MSAYTRFVEFIVPFMKETYQDLCLPIDCPLLVPLPPPGNLYCHTFLCLASFLIILILLTYFDEFNKTTSLFEGFWTQESGLSERLNLSERVPSKPVETIWWMRPGRLNLWYEIWSHNFGWWLLQLSYLGAKPSTWLCGSQIKYMHSGWEHVSRELAVWVCGLLLSSVKH